jgi:hypothetical protein
VAQITNFALRTRYLRVNRCKKALRDVRNQAFARGSAAGAERERNGFWSCQSGVALGCSPELSPFAVLPPFGIYAEAGLRSAGTRPRR